MSDQDIQRVAWTVAKEFMASDHAAPEMRTAGDTDALYRMILAGFSQTEEDKTSMATAAGNLKVGDEVWVRGEINIVEEGDDWIEVVFDSATGHQFLSMKHGDVSPTPSPIEGASSLADAHTELVGNAGAAGQLSVLRDLADKLCDCADRTLNGRARELANELRGALEAVPQSERDCTCKRVLDCPVHGEEPWCELCGHTGWLRDSDGNRTERCVCVAAAAPKPVLGEDAWLDEIAGCQLGRNAREATRTILRAYRANLLSQPAPACEAPPTHGRTGTCCENGNFGQAHICCKSPGNLPPNITDLRERMFKLDRLLMDPHPGLTTWVSAYGNAAKHLLQFFDEANDVRALAASVPPPRSL